MLSLLQKTIAGLTETLRLLDKAEDIRHAKLFEKIIGHKDIKKIFSKAIFSEKPVHILLVGDPGSPKTLFLMEIYRLFKASLFVIGSNTTKAGLLNQLFATLRSSTGSFKIDPLTILLMVPLSFSRTKISSSAKSP